ncbi:MAG: hypothetical protein ACI33S_02160 [Bacilli bacterium]
MKKILGVLLALVLVLSPVTNVLAASELEEVNLDDYKYLDLSETLKSEEMELSSKDYKETDDQVTIYLFRGEGCGYCRSFLTFLNSIVDEYGKYFKVVSFESWYDENNANLLTNLSTFMNNPAQGVPYIIIGDQVFPGYASDYDDSIKSVIKTLYESDERYDVIEAYNDYVKEENKKSSQENAGIILWNAVITFIAAGVVMLHVSSSNRKMLRTMGYLPNSLEDETNEEEDMSSEVISKKELKKEKKTNNKAKVKKNNKKED